MKDKNKKPYDRELIRLSKTGNYFYSDIAKRLGEKDTTIRYRAKQLGLPSAPAFNLKTGQWNRKYSERLIEDVMTYFTEHTQSETEKRFGLTSRQFRSIFTNGYKIEKFAHLRKDTRRKDAWTIDEWLFLVRHAGLLERHVIGEKLKRSKKGGYHVVKDRMRSAGGGSSKFLNGMPLRWCYDLWPED